MTMFGHWTCKNIKMFMLELFQLMEKISIKSMGVYHSFEKMKL